MGAKGVHTIDHLLRDEEIKILKKNINSPTEWAAIIIPLYTGMRVSELLHMKKDWIDWSAEIINIPPKMPCPCYDCRKVKKSKDKVVGEWSPKTKNGARGIPMLPEEFPDLIPTLKEVFEHHEQVMELLRNRGNVWMIQQAVLKRSGLERKLFPHVFRGTYAKLIARSEIDAFHLKDLMGWHDIKIACEYIRMAGTEIQREMRRKVRDYGKQGLNRSWWDRFFKRSKNRNA